MDPVLFKLDNLEDLEIITYTAPVVVDSEGRFKPSEEMTMLVVGDLSVLIPGPVFDTLGLLQAAITTAITEAGSQ